MSEPKTTEYAQGWDDHVLAVKPELEQLRTWKQEQMLVESTWDPQEIAKELGLTLGTDIRPQILPKIRELRTQLAAAQGVMATDRRIEAGLRAQLATASLRLAAAERQIEEIQREREALRKAKAEQREEWHNTLKQLAVAQAAMIGIRSLLESKPLDCLGTGEANDGMTWPIRDEVIDNINKVLKGGTAALDAAIAEATKPLVDALKEARPFVTHEMILLKIDTALSQLNQVSYE